MRMASLDKWEKKRQSVIAASKQDVALTVVISVVTRKYRTQSYNALFAYSSLAEYCISTSAGTATNPSATFIEDDSFGPSSTGWGYIEACWRPKCEGHWFRDGPLSPHLRNEFLTARPRPPSYTKDLDTMQSAQNSRCI